MQTTTAIGTGSSGPTKTDWRAALSPVVIALAALLALQLLLALALDLGARDMAPAGSQGALLAFDPDQVTGIRVEAPEGEPVVVTKSENGWIVPSLQNLPAAEHKVTGLLTKLQGLKKGLPVATSEEALERFKVADQRFERKLTLERGDSLPVVLYLGDSPGFRRLFVRAAGDSAGDSAVYDAELGLFDAPDKADNWSDRSLLHLDADKIQKLTLPGLTLERKDGEWRLADLAEGEVQDEEAIEDAVRQVANLDFLGVLAGEKEPAVDKDASPVEIEAALAEGDTVRYKITKLAEGDDYLLEASNRPQHFTLSSYMAEGLTGTKRADLLRMSAEPEQGAPEKAAPAGGLESGRAEPEGKPPPSSSAEAGV